MAGTSLVNAPLTFSLCNSCFVRPPRLWCDWLGGKGTGVFWKSPGVKILPSPWVPRAGVPSVLRNLLTVTRACAVSLPVSLQRSGERRSPSLTKATLFCSLCDCPLSPDSGTFVFSSGFLPMWERPPRVTVERCPCVSLEKGVLPWSFDCRFAVPGTRTVTGSP